uniref:T-box domain-containing protein n=1 Tax=Caenorhabditis tropicalis TaxID=1561998 RepID=A0A1I7UWL0_9PELO
MNSITVSLVEKDLWMEVYPYMEMIARSSKLCPEIKFSLAGLEKDQEYKIFVSLERHGDPKRFSFDKETFDWKESKKGYKKPHQTKIIEHSLGIQSGETWMKEPVEFSEIKISAKKEDQNKDNILPVHTHHKYIPVIRIMNVNTNMESTFPIEEAQFIPVTIYSNKIMGSWKSRNNKYTTFRHGGKGKRKASGGEPKAKRSKKGGLKKKQIRSEDTAPMANSSPSTASNSNQTLTPTANFNTPTTFHTAQMQFQPFGQAPYFDPMAASMNGYNTQWNHQYHMDYFNYSHYYNYPVFNPYSDPTFSVNSTSNTPQSSASSSSTPSPVTFNSQNIPPPVHFPHF